MEDNFEVKSTFLTRILRFFSKLFFRKNKKTVEPISYSRFSHFLDALDESDESYESVSAAAYLCDDGIRVLRQRISMSNKIQELSEKLFELECFNSLSEEETDRLKKLLTMFQSLSRERTSLIYDLTSYDQSLTHLINVEKEAAFSVPQIQDAEKNQRILRHDLAHLRGEKAELEYEREVLDRGLDLLNKFVTLMVVIFGFSAALLGFMYIYNGSQIFYMTSVFTVLIIAVVTLTFIVRRKMIFEIRFNLKKQNRAVELLNKKNAVYAYYTNFLNFVYKKYDVKNANVLTARLKEYEHYKHTSSRIDNIRKIMYETENEIEKFLRSKNIATMKNSIEGFAKTIDVEDKRRFYKEISVEKRALENDLFSLDKRHEKIWDTLVELNEADKTETRLVEKIIQAYLDEVSKMLETYNPLDDQVQEADQRTEKQTED